MAGAYWILVLLVPPGTSPSTSFSLSLSLSLWFLPSRLVMFVSSRFDVNHQPQPTQTTNQELYEALEAPLLSVEERLDVLLHLKWTVGEFDCRLTRDISELVDREADLLSRGRGEASLRPLRQRIRNLFLRFAETPDFNPEATRFVRVPPKYEKLTEEGLAGLTGVVSCK